MSKWESVFPVWQNGICLIDFVMEGISCIVCRMAIVVNETIKLFKDISCFAARLAHSDSAKVPAKRGDDASLFGGE